MCGFILSALNCGALNSLCVSCTSPLATEGIWGPAFETVQWMLALTEWRNPELHFGTIGVILVTLFSVKVLISKAGREELRLFPVIGDGSGVTVFVVSGRSKELQGESTDYIGLVNLPLRENLFPSLTPFFFSFIYFFFSGFTRGVESCFVKTTEE